MRENININKLIVNPENYRFDSVENQSQAIDLMLEEKGSEIFNLAKHIAEHGLDEAKNLRVTEIKKDLYKILEGNRRITALKCLHDFSLIKSESLKNKFKKLIEETNKENKNIPSMVNCFVYKNEEDVAKWIKLDHTGKNEGVGLVEWGKSERDRFEQKFEGKSSPATQAVDLYESIMKTKIQDRNKLKLSTINRLLSNAESRAYLGLGKVNEKIYPVAPLKEVGERLDKLFNKMILEDIPVKDVYNTGLIIKFMKNLYGEKPKLSKKPVKIPTETTKKVKKKKKTRFPKSNERNILIPNTFILEIEEKKPNNIYHELMDMPLDQFPNAIGVLFRVFLEISLDCYAEKICGINFSKNTNISGKITKITEDLEKRNIASGNQLKNIKNVGSKRNSILSIENFHEYIHSYKNQPMPTDLIIAWDNLQEFFEIIWEEISKKKKKK